MSARAAANDRSERARERPILFSAPMVVATLNDSKTQTRRCIRQGTPKTKRIYWASEVETVPRGRYTGWVHECDAPLLLPLTCPYGVVGDRLWVREAFAYSIKDPDAPNEEHSEENHDVVYRADYSGGDWDHYDEHGARTKCAPPWRPSIHMPRWASRITLEVRNVQAQRVHDISDADIAAEGVNAYVGAFILNGEATTGFVSAQYRFAQLWDSVNGARPGKPFGEAKTSMWQSNPWVWVVEFGRVQP